MVDTGEFVVFWVQIGEIGWHYVLWGFSWEGLWLTRVWSLTDWVSNLCRAFRVLLKVQFWGKMVYFEGVGVKW